MDRTFAVATVVFVALAVVGLVMAAAPTSITSVQADQDALRAIGGALFAAGLAAFLVEGFRWDRTRRV